MLLSLLLACAAATPQTPGAVQATVPAPPILAGIFKVVLDADVARHFSLDAQFNFAADGTFSYSCTAGKALPVIKGVFQVKNNQVELSPVNKDAAWPSSWHSPELASVDAGGLKIEGVLYAPNSGAASMVGRWSLSGSDCRYDFDEKGKWSFEGQGQMSGGEYAVQNEATSGKTFLVLTITQDGGMPISGCKPMKLELCDSCSSFIVAGAFKYTRAVVAAAGTGKKG